MYGVVPPAGTALNAFKSPKFKSAVWLVALMNRTRALSAAFTSVPAGAVVGALLFTLVVVFSVVGLLQAASPRMNIPAAVQAAKAIGFFIGDTPSQRGSAN